MSSYALDHVQVVGPPGCLVEARRFYGELLGLPELERPQTMGGESVWFGVGSQELHVAADEGFVPAARAHPALRLELQELEALAARLEQAGVEVSWDERLPGSRRFYTRDPWGNRLEFLARGA
ncbi:MAG: VOC family protein [Gaiellaceae bacterium]